MEAKTLRKSGVRATPTRMFRFQHRRELQRAISAGVPMLRRLRIQTCVEVPPPTSEDLQFAAAMDQRAAGDYRRRIATAAAIKPQQKSRAECGSGTGVQSTAYVTNPFKA